MPQIRNHKDLGEFNKKILFQRRAKVSDGGGGYRANWSNLKTKWAKRKQRTGLAQGQLAMHHVWFDEITFTIVYDSDIHTTTTGDIRVVYPASGDYMKAYKIKKINPVGGESYFLEIECDGNESESV